LRFLPALIRRAAMSRAVAAWSLRARLGAVVVVAAVIGGGGVGMALASSLDPALRLGAAVLALAVALGLAGAMAWRVGRAAQRALSQCLDRGPLDLGPVVVDDPPAELLPLMASVDRLMQSMQRTLARERDFISVAAHEMRSPLAGLRAHAQVARRARNGAERDAALAAVMHGVDRTAYRLDQLLDMARIDALADRPGDAPVQAVDLAALFDRILDDLSPRAAAKRLTITADFPVASLVGVEFGLDMLLRNLLANAIAHTPDGGRIAVRSVRGEDGIALIVDDSGPGIALAERDKVFARFYRGRGDRTDGVGLGLAIVQAIAVAHQGSVTLSESPDGGLRAVVVLPHGAALERHPS
jgi:two-component system OmpR family sensor kinase/two-component system sensor histidine kinase QseC